MFFIWDWNFSFYIWLVWFLLFLILFSIIKKERYSRWLDVLINPLLLLLLFASTADLLSWSNYWIPTDLPIWITFSVPEVRYTIPIHPVQIYEIIWISLIFILLFLLWTKKRKDWVQSALWFSLLFLLEFILVNFLAGSDLLVYDIKFHFLLFWSLFFISLIYLISKSHLNLHVA